MSKLRIPILTYTVYDLRPLLCLLFISLNNINNFIQFKKSDKTSRGNCSAVYSKICYVHLDLVIE